MSTVGTPIHFDALSMKVAASVTIGYNNSIYDLKQDILEEICIPGNVKVSCAFG
ncbi:18111_t:CDS:1, partial [Funneliformis geosporum]